MFLKIHFKGINSVLATLFFLQTGKISLFTYLTIIKSIFVSVSYEEKESNEYILVQNGNICPFKGNNSVFATLVFLHNFELSMFTYFKIRLHVFASLLWVEKRSNVYINDTSEKSN